MFPKKINYNNVGGLVQLSPYFVFLLTYSFLYCYKLPTKNPYLSELNVFIGLPLCAIFIALVYAYFTFKESTSMQKKIEVFLTGIAHIDAIYTYFTILCITLLNHTIAQINGILTVVTLSLIYIPTSTIMIILFFISAFFACIIRSLSTTTILCLPIAHGIAQSLEINPAFMAATIISGALFGTHVYLNMLIQEHKKSLIEKIINFCKQTTTGIIFSAAIITCIIISQYQCTPLHYNAYHYLKSSFSSSNYISIIPYCILLITSFVQKNLIANLIISICSALIIEFFYYKIPLFHAIITMFHGFSHNDAAVSILLIYILIAGLIKIIKYNDGFHYLIEQLRLKGNQNSKTIFALISILTITVNILVIIEEMTSHLLIHPIKKLTERYTLNHTHVTILFYIITTTMQVILPYTGIILITAYITHSSYNDIIYYMIYPILLGILTTLSICIV